MRQWGKNGSIFIFHLSKDMISKYQFAARINKEMDIACNGRHWGHAIGPVSGGRVRFLFIFHLSNKMISRDQFAACINKEIDTTCNDRHEGIEYSGGPVLV